jgi:hypothetical protein
VAKLKEFKFVESRPDEPWTIHIRLEPEAKRLPREPKSTNERDNEQSD